MVTQHTPNVSVNVQIEHAPVTTTNRLAGGTLRFQGGPLDVCASWDSRAGRTATATVRTSPSRRGPTSLAAATSAPVPSTDPRRAHSVAHARLSFRQAAGVGHARPDTASAIPPGDEQLG